MTLDRIRIGGLAGHDSTPFCLAISSGLYEQEGLDVEWVDLHNRGPRELEKDGLDLCVCSLEGALYHILQPESNLVLAGTYIASKRTKGIYSTQADDEAFSNGSTVFPVTGKGGSGHILASLKAKDLGAERSPKFQECGSAGAVLAAMEDASTKKDQPSVVVWDKYAAQSYVSAGKWHAIGEIMTPWSSSVFTAHRRVMEPNRWGVIEKFFAVSRKAIIGMCSSPGQTIEHVCQNFGLTKCDAKHWMLSSLFSCQPVTSTEDIQACTEQLRQLDQSGMTVPKGGICADGCREVQTSAEVASLAHFHTWHDSAMKLFSMTPVLQHNTGSVTKNQKPTQTLDVMSTTVGDEDLMSLETHTMMPLSPHQGDDDPSTSNRPEMQCDSPEIDNADSDLCSSSFMYNKIARPRVMSSLSSPYLRHGAPDAHDRALKISEESFVSNSARTAYSKDATQSAAIIDHHFGPEGAAILLSEKFCSTPDQSVQFNDNRERITDHHFGQEEVTNSVDTTGDFCSNSSRSVYSKANGARRQMMVTDQHFSPEKSEDSVGGDFCSNPGRSVYSKSQGATNQVKVTDHHFGPEEVTNSSDATGDFCSNSSRSVYSKANGARHQMMVTDQHFSPEKPEDSVGGDFCANPGRSVYSKSHGATNQVKVTDHHFGPEEVTNSCDATGDCRSAPGRSVYSKGQTARSQMEVTDHHFGQHETTNPPAVDVCSTSRASGYSKVAKGTSQMAITDHHFGPQDDFHSQAGANLLGGLMGMCSDSMMDLLYGPDGHFL